MAQRDSADDDKPDPDRGASERTTAARDKTRSDAFSINGPMGWIPGSVPPALQAWARTTLAALFGDDEAQRPSQSEEDPRKIDSNILVAAPGETPIHIDDLLANALADVGYRRVDKLIYRADWSTSDVEHVLTFDTYGTPKEFLIADVGLRNKDAEAFSEQCQRRYARPSMRNSDYVQPPWWCPMHCSLGMLAHWKSDNLYTPNFSQAEIGSKVTDAVRDFVMPYVGGVTTIDRFFEFLDRDTEPMRWFRVGGYFRAAEVAFLGCKLGVPPETLRATLWPYRPEMRNGLDEKELTPDEYIAHIIHDAKLALGEASR